VCVCERERESSILVKPHSLLTEPKLETSSGEHFLPGTMEKKSKKGGGKLNVNFMFSQKFISLF
jgi:hypothetical protein